MSEKMIIKAIYNSLYEITDKNEFLSISNTLNLPRIDKFPDKTDDVNLNLFIETSQQLLIQQYGALSVQGMMIRTGRSSFEYLLNNTEVFSELTDLNFRLLSRPKKIWQGLRYLVDKITLETGLNFILDQDEDNWLLKIEKDSSSHNELTKSLYNFLIGFLQEFMYWSSGGRTHNIYRSNGDTQAEYINSLIIDKKTID